jgi:O-antigen/teichoic acid export membrane protein
MTSLYNASAAWIRTRAPRFGMLVSQRAYSALDRLYFRVTTPAVAVLALALGLFWGFVAILYAVEFRYAVRLLPPLPTALLAVAMCAGLISDSQWNYIHAHKRSPFMRLGIAASLTTGFLVWLLGSRYGATGIGIAFVLMNGCFYLPVWTWAWRRCRSQWHESIELE